MNIYRNPSAEIRNELEEILIVRIRSLHHSPTDGTATDIEINRSICELGRVLAAVLGGSNDKAKDSGDEACYRCERVNCRNRK